MKLTDSVLSIPNLEWMYGDTATEITRLLDFLHSLEVLFLYEHHDLKKFPSPKECAEPGTEPVLCRGERRLTPPSTAWKRLRQLPQSCTGSWTSVEVILHTPTHTHVFNKLRNVAVQLHSDMVTDPITTMSPRFSRAYQIPVDFSPSTPHLHSFILIPIHTKILRSPSPSPTIHVTIVPYQ